MVQLVCSAVPAPSAPRLRRPQRGQLQPRRQQRRLAAARRGLPPAAAASGGRPPSAPPVSLTLPDGTQVAMAQAALVIGSAADADLQLQGAHVAAQHARLDFKGGRLFATALSGDPDVLLAPTHCWLDGVELRPGVSRDAGRRGA